MFGQCFKEDAGKCAFVGPISSVWRRWIVAHNKDPNCQRLTFQHESFGCASAGVSSNKKHRHDNHWDHGWGRRHNFPQSANFGKSRYVNDYYVQVGISWFCNWLPLSLFKQVKNFYKLQVMLGTYTSPSTSYKTLPLTLPSRWSRNWNSATGNHWR